MPTTSPDNLPYPGLGDPPDGPDQIGALAAATQTALNGKSATSHNHHDVYGRLVGNGSQSGTVQSNGVETSRQGEVNVSLTNGRKYLMTFSADVDNSGTGYASGVVRMKAGTTTLGAAYLRIDNEYDQAKGSVGKSIVMTWAGSTGTHAVGVTIDRAYGDSGSYARMSGGTWSIIDLGT